MTDRKGTKDADLLIRLVEEQELLLCGVQGCAHSLSLATTPAPADAGWVLEYGWWLCPLHVGWMSWIDSPWKAQRDD